MPSKNSKSRYTSRFIVKFNNGRQSVKVIVEDNPKSFRRRNKCHAWYIAKDVRKKRSGLFGYIHLPLTELSPYMTELIGHEVQHLINDWILCHKGFQLSEKNDERVATMTGELNKRIQARYEKILQKSDTMVLP